MVKLLMGENGARDVDSANVFVVDGGADAHGRSGWKGSQGLRTRNENGGAGAGSKDELCPRVR